MTDWKLSPELATFLFIVLCFSGYRYRRLWKNEGVRHKLWLYGLLACACFLALAFIPLSTSS